MEVPDVSLIYSPSMAPNGYVSASALVPVPIKDASNKMLQPTPTDSTDKDLQEKFVNRSLISEDLKKEMRALAPLVASQGASILKIEEKLDRILEFQETFLSQLFRKGIF